MPRRSSVKPGLLSYLNELFFNVRWAVKNDHSIVSECFHKIIPRSSYNKACGKNTEENYDCVCNAETTITKKPSHEEFLKFFEKVECFVP
ncbi:MAG: hypothetical protein UU47_C0003G0007 [candidate division TM6 bacterium GW2011_GWE2_41_16]|nr:MAG: hypothetical protein UU47_C0003G0007 [candidate division TM6 bacterium GW2011_GWE2_41_16]